MQAVCNLPESWADQDILIDDGKPRIQVTLRCLAGEAMAQSKLPSRLRRQLRPHGRVSDTGSGAPLCGLRLCAWANLKPMPGRIRRSPFSAFPYRYRSLLERFFSKLKHFRAVAICFEKHSENEECHISG